MTLSALGILSAAGAGGVQGDYELIETVILGSTTATVTFSGLAAYASTYKHLEIRMAARSDRADSSDILEMLVNATAATRVHMLFGDGSSVGSADAPFGMKGIGTTTGATFAANGFSGTVISILDAYSSTKNKTTRTLSGVSGVSGSHRWISLAPSFYGTDPVSSITLDVIASFVSGSRFSLYGIRG